MIRAGGCPALCMLLGAQNLQQHPVSAFVPSVSIPNAPKSSYRHSLIQLQGGGEQGGSAHTHSKSSRSEAEKEQTGGGGGSGDTAAVEEGGSDIDVEDEPFPMWKGMSSFEVGESQPPPAGVIVVDPFCDYLGKRCIAILEEAGYAVVQVLSDHLVTTLGNESAKGFRPPKPGKEADWASWLPFPIVAVICESDAGLANAERLQAALLGPRFGGVNDARRDKFLMNEAMRAAGLAAARQIKTGDRSQVEEFLAAISSAAPSPLSLPQGQGIAGDQDVDEQKPENAADGVPVPGSSSAAIKGTGSVEAEGDAEVRSLDGVLSVVKPSRGCASGSVYLCRGKDEAMEAFEKIRGTPKYGTPGEFNDEVLVQEFLSGTEYVVDTVSRDGVHKAVAIWRYDKRPANGAPFVYFSVKLMPSDGVAERKVVEYAFKALDALEVKYGPTHTEVMMVKPSGNSSDGEEESPENGTPTLVEVNTRWHLTDFAPLTDACVGYNAVEETLSAYLDPGRFDALPRVPPTGGDTRYGRVVHLVSYVEGGLEQVNHEEEIRNLESFVGMDVYADPKNGGSGEVKKTVDIRSDAGWVQLVHDREEVVERDFRRVVELMPTMYTVSGNRESAVE